MTYDKDSIEFLPHPTNPHFQDVTGQVFNGVTVLGLSHKQRTYYQWFVECHCGVIFTIRMSSLKNGHTKSCGCLTAERMRTMCLKHGLVGTFEYRVWQKMKDRCLNANELKYIRYGGRGITICERWIHSFENFLADMGKSPSDKHSIERVDNNGNYCPENCKWGTISEQANNKRSNVRLTLNHQTQTMAQWAREKGLPYTCLRARLKAGWSVEDALTIPSRAR